MTAAAEMMTNVREALEAAFGLGPTREQIERREQEAEARAAFRAAAAETERWQEFWDEQRRRMEAAAQPPGAGASLSTADLHQAFRDRAGITSRYFTLPPEALAAAADYADDARNPFDPFNTAEDFGTGFDDTAEAAQNYVSLNPQI